MREEEIFIELDLNFFSEVLFLPEHKLIIGVIERGIQDLEGYGRNREDALEWFVSNTDEPFSFVWCCESLRCHPDWVRRQIISRIWS